MSRDLERWRNDSCNSRIVYSWDLNEISYVGRERWLMHDGMPANPIQRQGQGHESLKVRIPSIFEIYLPRHLQWELTSDHWFLNQGTISTFVQAKFLIFVLVSVSRDFELGGKLCAL